MDRRTVIFAILVFVTLFGVNLYFDSQYEEQVRQWNTSQEVKKKQLAGRMEQEINEKTAQPSELPLYTAYADAQGKNALTAGIYYDNAFLAIAWDANLPENIYIRPQGTEETPKKLSLTYNPKAIDQPVVYQASGKAPLLIGSLPDVGNFNLQAIQFIAKDGLPVAQIELANYIDGVVTITRDQLNTLKTELDPAAAIPSKPSGEAILLMKSEKAYLPVALFNRATKNVLYLEDAPDLETKQSTQPEPVKALAAGKNEQKFYVLENDYQQLVFSNVGGALVEINLPFQSKANTASAVREIEFDRDIKESHAYNDHFPAHPYFTAGSQPTGPYAENLVGKIGGYYPLIRRDLIESNQSKTVVVNPRFYALNLLSEFPEFAELHYTVKHFDKNSITFEGQQRQRKITKTFSLPIEKNAPYCFDLKISITGEKRGLWLSSGVPEVELFSGSPDPVLKYRITRNQKSYVESIDLPQQSFSSSTVTPDWVCNSNGFFGIIIDPLTQVDAGYKAVQVPGQTVPSRLVEIDQSHDRFEAKNFPGYMLMTPLNSAGGSMDFRIFAGPFSSAILKSVDATYADETTGYNPDYIACQSYHGWFSFISEPFAKLLFILMNFFHTLTGSWGFSIILLTAALRLMLYPLNAWSTKSMLRMQKIAPMVTAIQEKYKKDPKKVQIEIMNLYRDQGVNPMSGCVPMLIQMPFLIGMFDLLKTTFELRGASFVPGWIDNLTSPDVLFSWHTPIFFIGNQFHLLPILLGVVMFFQQRMSAPAIDPNQMTDQQRQQRAMGTLMPVIFTFMFYNFPSGLNIYWLSSMLLAMLQQWWMQSRMEKNKAVPVETVKPKK